MSEQKMQINLKKMADALVNGLNKTTGEKWKVKVINTKEPVQIYKYSEVAVIKTLKLLAIVKENSVIKAKDYKSKIGTEIIPLELLHSTKNWENAKRDLLSTKPNIKNKVDNWFSIVNEYNSFMNELEVFNIKSNKYYFLYQVSKKEIDAIIKEEKNRQKIEAILNRKQKLELEKTRIVWMQEEVKMEENEIKNLEEEMKGYKVVKNELEV